MCLALGYSARPTFYDRLTLFERHENLHVVKTAFEVIGIHAVFGLAEGNSTILEESYVRGERGPGRSLL